MSFSLKVSRKLYNSYSPYKTNNSLSNIYVRVTNDYTNVKDIRKQFNDLIMANYLNESVIKSAFVKRELSKRSPRLNVCVFELNALGSRADLVLVNGSSYVYEIKTEYDSFSRLLGQLSDYEKLFEYLYVIVPKADVISVKSLINYNVGIISYSLNRLGNVIFEYERNANLNNLIDSYLQLTTLTKKELLILNNNSNDYSLNKNILIDNLVSTLNKDEINKIYKESIKNAYFNKWNFLHNNLDNIYELDYQWFFKNNIDYKLIYR